MAALGLRAPRLSNPRWSLGAFSVTSLTNVAVTSLATPRSFTAGGSAPSPSLSRSLPGERGLVAALKPRPCVIAVPGPRRTMAGHNRWSKVRNVKGPRDAERSRIFQRLAQMLRAAVREGGAEPSLNPSLAAVVEQCRARNMPKASIEAAIRGAQARPAGGSRLILGARGPGGSALLLELLTEDPRRSQRQIGELLARNGAALSEAVRQSFEATGVVRVAAELSLEAALEVAAVAGAQDVAAEGDDGHELKFLCPPSALGSVRQGLEAAGLRPLSAAVEFEPRARLELSERSSVQARQLLAALAEWPDLVRLYHNIGQWPEGGGAGPEGGGAEVRQRPRE